MSCEAGAFTTALCQPIWQGQAAGLSSGGMGKEGNTPEPDPDSTKTPTSATISTTPDLTNVLSSIQESIGHLQTAIAAQARGADRQLVHQYLEYASETPSKVLLLKCVSTLLSCKGAKRHE